MNSETKCWICNRGAEEVVSDFLYARKKLTSGNLSELVSESMGEIVMLDVLGDAVPVCSVCQQLICRIFTIRMEQTEES